MSVFPVAEYRARLARAQGAMAGAGLTALLLTTEPEVRYFTGFLTRFWESPTRPWFVVVPAAGDPVAVIPSIGAPLMARGWLTDIRTWVSPDPANDGIPLLAETLREKGGARIGLPSGPETHVRIPLESFRALTAAVAPARLGGDGGLMARLRAVKSPAEIALIRSACAIAGRAFARVPEIARPGVPLSQVFRDFQCLALAEGADWVPYLAGGAGPRGQGDVISPATDAPLAAGDVLMLDTGLVKGGYFCDFDRNFALGPVTREIDDAYRTLIEATRAAFGAARPGATARDLYAVMEGFLHTGGQGRLGHGLGMQLTEGLSLIAADPTPLEPGMVLTLEPWIATGPGSLLVHEENIVITGGGAEWLTSPAPETLPRI
ncbi:M24 family metallopeptidase [Oceaniglobus roseus]|uniref:M24 family metallopeptidase n=1 Tax=Oceaniglobus roseus TaxID=1737570 RepID=UPI000C7F0FF9|nr:Xaa-Pro peptidase family protein [Kandeliimicrobium roseum]